MDESMEIERVRIVQRPIPKQSTIAGDRGIATVDDIRSGVGALWVELVMADGESVKVASIAGFEITGTGTGHAEATTTRLTLDVLGPVELLYALPDGVDEDGRHQWRELTFGEIDPAAVFPQPVDYSTETPVPR
jgi:hypothetical protein